MHLWLGAIIAAHGSVTTADRVSCAFEMTRLAMDRCVQLDATSRYFVLWNALDPGVTGGDGSIDMQLVVHNRTSLQDDVGGAGSWIGFGLNQQPSMPGADIVVLYRPAVGADWVIEDRVATEQQFDSKPPKDADQNYVLLKTEDIANGPLQFLVRRQLNTCDVLDVEIRKDQDIFCLWALGTRPVADAGTFQLGNVEDFPGDYHGPTRRGAQLCRFFRRSDLEVSVVAGTTEHHEIRSSDPVRVNFLAKKNPKIMS